MLMELWNRRRDEVAKTGEIALARAREAGVTAYYMEDATGDAIIAHHPDGTREIVTPSKTKEQATNGKPTR